MKTQQTYVLSHVFPGLCASSTVRFLPPNELDVSSRQIFPSAVLSLYHEPCPDFHGDSNS